MARPTVNRRKSWLFDSRSDVDDDTRLGKLIDEEMGGSDKHRDVNCRLLKVKDCSVILVGMNWEGGVI